MKKNFIISIQQATLDDVQRKADQFPPDSFRHWILIVWKYWGAAFFGLWHVRRW